MSIRRLFVLAAALAASFVALPRSAQAQTDIIRGRVVGPDSLPIEGATITVTSIANNTNKSARTDKNGRFAVPFPGGDGDYWVNIAALGFAAKRFEVKRTADQDILVGDELVSVDGETLENRVSRLRKFHGASNEAARHPGSE